MIGEHTALVSRQVAKTGLQIIVPDTYAPAFVCTVPVSLEDACGVSFGPHERSAYEAHVAKCIKANEQVIHAAKPSIQREILGNGIWDKDLERFMEENREALLEGRMRL